MKLSLVIPLLLAANLQVSAFVFGQTITIKKSNISLTQFLKEVQKQSGYNIFYNESLMSAGQRFDVAFEKIPFQSALQNVLDRYQLNYKIVDKNIILSKKDIFLNAYVSQHPISGKVVDEQGNPLAGVTVTSLADGSQTVTKEDGGFSLQLKDDAATLRFSMIGFTTKEVRVSNETNLVVQMEIAFAQMSEVVVVGYGTQKKEHLTGAITVVDSKLLQSRPAANVSSLLQGTVPNLQVKFSTGRPGATGNFNIRGINSISSNASPLVIIDGFEGDINRINPNDVESVTVLKDASSAAVYGARASYGVILVTTKKGDKSRAAISYSAQTSVSAPTTSTDFETRGYDWALITDQFFSSYSGTPYTRYTEEDYKQLFLRRDDKTEHPDRPWLTIQNRDGRDSYVYYANTDWYQHLFNTRRPMQSHSLNINGSSEKIDYNLSGNYFDQEGIYRQNPDNIKTYNLRSRVNFKVKSWLDINTNLSYFTSGYSFPGSGNVENVFNNSAFHAPASFLPVNPDGTSVYQTNLTAYNLMDGHAALLNYDKHRNLDRVSEFTPTIEAVFKPLKGLDIRTSYRFTHYNDQAMNRSVNIPYSKFPGEILTLTSGIGNNRLFESQINHQYQALNAYATYSKTIKENHDFKVMVGYNYETKRLKDIKVARNGLLSNELSDFEIAAGSVSEINGGQNEYALFGTFYRANYVYKDKYLFEAGGRYDGTTRFAKGRRYGFFPSFSAGWRMDKEEFFQNWNQDVLNGFKIRATYGSLGNQQVGYYDYIQTINAGNTVNYSFGEGSLAPVATESAPNSPSLTWETVNSGNLGLDIELLKSRLTFTGDIYQRETMNMLTAGKAIPSYYGTTIPRENASDLLTKGWEISVTWNDKFNLAGKKFSYYLGAGLGDNTSKITRFDNPNNNLASFYEGQNLGDIWGYVVNGYFLTDQEAANYPVDQRSVNTIINSSAKDRGLFAGDLKFEDLDGNNVISTGSNTLDNPGDRKVIGNSLPRYNFNFNTGGSWNNIDLSVFVQGVGKQDWYPGHEATVFWGPYSRPYATFLPRDFMDDVWTPENPNAYFPRPRGFIALSNVNRSLGVANTKYLQSLMYARVKNITLGYSLPGKVISKVGLSRLRMYVSGENLLTFTKLHSDYIDPEQASAENTYNVSASTAKTYPWAKTFMFGLDVSF